VVLTMVFTAIGLIAFTSALERFLFKTLSWPETFLMGLAALALFWPDNLFSALGALLLAILAIRQWLTRPQAVSRTA